MPGIPFVLARSQGCSWIGMCSCTRGDLENTTAEKQFVFVVCSNQTCRVIIAEDCLGVSQI